VYKIQEESTREVLEECQELFYLHHDELNSLGDSQKHTLNLPVLLALLEANSLVIITARDAMGIVAYWVTAVSPSLVHDELIGTELGIFVKKECRGGRLFLGLSKATEDALIKRSVKQNYVTFTEGHNESLPLKIGYLPVERTYRKVLGE
jgi:hypothetical protein